MGLSDELGRLTARATEPTAPKGWQPGVEFDDSSGEGRTAPRPASNTPPSHEEILQEFGLDPEAWQVVTLRRSKWQQSKRLENGDRDLIWLEAWRATFRAVTPNDPRVVQADFDAMARRIGGWKRPRLGKQRAASGPAATFVCVLSDLQLGKGEGGGSQAIVDRVLNSLGGAVEQLHNLRQLGYAVSEVAIVGLGDIIENCSEFYPMQTFQADLSLREQQALAWDLIARYIDTFSALAERVQVGFCAGNHGEPRREGKAFTTFSDNYDLLALDVMRRYQERDPNWGNVEVLDHQDPLAISMELSGAKLGAVHGHQFGKGQGAVEKARIWWQGQALGNGHVADTDILLCGHLHHFVVNEVAQGRTFIQSPSQDGGSYWFRNLTGQAAETGMLTMLVGSDLGPRKYDHLRVV